MKTIFTVACEIPGGFGEYIDFDSQASLLDADFVLFNPTLGHYMNLETYKGKPALSDNSSFQLKEKVNHWNRELADVLNAGKTVFVMMSLLEEVYVNTGKKEHSGTGRNRHTTNIVALLSNYHSMPFSIEVIGSTGTSMILHPNENILREYWEQFGGVSEYRVRIEKSKLFRPLISTRYGSSAVGAIFRAKSGGALVALPWIDFYDQKFIDEEREDNGGGEESTWTSEAIEWGEKYSKTLESLDETIRSQRKATPIPQWVRDEKFMTNQETVLAEELLQIQSKMSDLRKKQEEIEAQAESLGSLKRLLFEQGHALEDAILEVMRLMGFRADRYRDSDSEFDAVLECPEGRCIGEAEGRDNKPINVDKMRQLADNINQDFSRDEVSEPAKGVLFGNAHRLTQPQDRPAEHFTAKCMQVAERNGTALIRTCDLFEVAKALTDESDAKYAASCRKVIFDTAGKVVRFPTPPKRPDRS